MNSYQKELATLLATSKALYFAEDLVLKDGRPTPYFLNFGLFHSGKLISDLGKIMADFLVSTNTIDDFDVLVGPSYKGSALAVATSIALFTRHQVDKGFDYNRKEEKSHGEASLASTAFVTGVLKDESRVLIIDDVATTMKTKFDILGLLTAEAVKRGQSYYPAGVAMFIDREQTTAVYDSSQNVKLGVKGQNSIKNFKIKTGLEVQTILGIRETVAYLAQEKIPVLQNGTMKPLEKGTVDDLTSYLEIYGV
ncbi:MAG: hypothetical protein LBF22_14075 [Deltaproteobacteria bacterium]|jgi:orotate phosphoribosyltransferase|nr:hypothetical protein [Deltaproteobacteria bacterium]